MASKTNRNVTFKLPTDMSSKVTRHAACKLPTDMSSKVTRHAACKLPTDMSSKVTRHAACKLPTDMSSKVTRHAACKLPTDMSSKVTRHAACKLPTDMRSKVTRHDACKLPIPVNSRTHTVPTLPVSIKMSPLTVEVHKVKADVSNLQKDLAVETAARNELHMCVERLKVETTEAKQLMIQAARDVSNPNNPTNALSLLMKALPCESLERLDWLLAYVANRNQQWIEYVKLQGGTDFNSAIKTVINATMVRSVQKQLSWDIGPRSKKPSLKCKYKSIVDGIHVAMIEQFRDYTIVQGEAKMQNLLANAARNS